MAPLHVSLSLDSGGDCDSYCDRRRSATRDRTAARYWFQQLPGRGGLDACTKSKETFTHGGWQGRSPRLWSPVAREYQIDSRWRTCCSTAFAVSILQPPGSRQLALAPDRSIRDRQLFGCYRSISFAGPNSRSILDLGHGCNGFCAADVWVGARCIHEVYRLLRNGRVPLPGSSTTTKMTYEALMSGTVQLHRDLCAGNRSMRRGLRVGRHGTSQRTGCMTAIPPFLLLPP
ncbi:uncharacterized protein THITE_2117344 [Thermothielavioides terrestris NRRL 8126]|uniref:Uncharacterized protein n=1 Tax=Thermothielavioides terrestris (strain ATCC 38088 / NRRL 8126) TaxID=578455 RepID=G2R7Y2_THETT|nr:uncharacterized protein THITE_2117344 [Thermothielavioides terrestris NRRL 8126]AEO68041.1 hypothetical protein THITE_2117344 [Thermothielavioides terrestris NRRL 8126]